MRTQTSSQKLMKMTAVALFTAISFALMITVKFQVSFLTLDVKDAVITLCGLSFGPGAALFISLVVPFFEMISISSTGIYGFFMNAVGSISFSVTASLIYRHKRNLFGAVLGIFSGAFCMVAVMLIFNLIITPYYFGCSASEVAGMIPTLLLPFNLVKAALNSGLVFLLYKPVSQGLRKTHFLPPSEKSFRMDAVSIWIVIISLLVVAASCAVLVRVLGGSFAIGL